MSHFFSHLFLRKKNKALKGFSLIELSVVIIIMSITASLVLSLAITNSDNKKVQTTQATMAKIEKAIGAFLANNQRLPCPADGTQARNDSNFGFEQIDTISNTMNPCTVNFISASGYITSGVVPVRTLLLEDNDMYDGWGRAISYSVDGRFAMNATGDNVVNQPSFPVQIYAQNISCAQAGPNSNCFRYLTQDNASIVTLTTSSNTLNPINSNNVMVLISHGKKGLGAFPLGGGTQIAGNSLNIDSYQNIDQTGFNGIYVQKNPIYSTDVTVYFDDIVLSNTKWQMIGKANILMDKTLCDTADAILKAAPKLTSQGGVAEFCFGSNNSASCTSYMTDFINKIQLYCFE